jgi:hypothetical protein
MPLVVKPLTPERKLLLERLKVKRKQKQLFKRLKHNYTNVFGVANAKFLARENLLTLLFVERLRRQTKRNITVVPIGQTGEPYTWGIEAVKPKGVKLANRVEYPSSQSYTNFYEQAQRELFDLLKKGGKNSIMICVDSSRSKRMPSSFVGHAHAGFTQPEDSIKHALEKKGYNVITVGYDYSRPRETFRFGGERIVDKLPRTLELKEKTVILLNPSKERTVKINNGTHSSNWRPAFHDDNMSGVPEGFKEYVQNQVRLAKRK